MHGTQAKHADARLVDGTKLVLGSRIRVERHGDVVHVEGPEDVVHGDDSTLALLARFARPCTIAEGIDVLPVRTKDEFVRATSQIVSLVGAGVLRASTNVPYRPDHGFADLEPHLEMIADQARMRAYVDAIRRVVRPDDVVVDLGTGSGVLAIAAAKAGARRVYAIERSEIAELAAEMFARNGVADRVTLVRGTSTQITLEERGTVLVSEIIGTEPLCERVLEYTRDAMARLLVPGARVLPSGMRVLARPVMIDDALLAEHVLAAHAGARLTEAYDIDFSAVVHASRVRPTWFTVPVTRAAGFRALTEDVEVSAIDLLDPPAPPIRARVMVPVTRAGRLDGIALYFTLSLDAKGALSSDPSTADASCSWGTAIWLMADRPHVDVGTALEVTYTYTAPRAVASVRVI